MATKATGEITFTDLSDAYTVMLTRPAHSFPGTTSAAKAGSVTTQVVALKGGTQVAAAVTVADIDAPSGVTVTSDNNSTSPTLTIAVSTSVVAAGTVTIPVSVDGGTAEVTLQFGFSIAFTGATGKGISGSPAVTYQASSSGTTAPTGTWSSTIPSVSASQYLWTRVVTTYTDSTTTTAYSVGMMGATGSAGKGINGNPVVTYQASSSGTTVPTGTWSSTIPSVSASQYLWTRTVITYTDSSTTTSYSVGMMGATGADGADAMSIVVTTDSGTVFKNGSGTSVATAHVFKGATELTGTALSAEGTISWYLNGSSTASATGQTITVNAASIDGTGVYKAVLAG